MNISDDTKKSLGFLKKSLKMSRRAVEKNQNDDGSTDAEVEGFQDAIDEVLTFITSFETTTAVPVSPVAPVAPQSNDPTSLFAPLTITNP